MKTPFSVGVITDEVSQNIEEAARFCKQHGLACMEVRSVNNHSPFEFTEKDVSDICAAAEAHGLSVCAVSSPLFKCRFDDSRAVAEHIAKFEQCAKQARRFGATRIRGFDFWDTGVALEQRAAAYRPIAEICEAYGVLCVIEADPSVHSNTPEATAQLVQAIGSPHIRVLFDPGNEIWVTGRASSNAYEAVKPYLAHVHIKDAIVTNGKAEAVKVGTGLVDYPNLFARLIADGYGGSILLETHYRKHATLTEEQLKHPGGAAFSDGAYEASEESVIALKQLLKLCKGV